MNSKFWHSPGPWKVDKYKSWDKVIIISEAGIMVDNDDVNQKEAGANAKMAAAAPNMFDLLLKLDRYFGNMEHNEQEEEIYKEIQKQIRRAGTKKR